MYGGSLEKRFCSEMNPGHAWNSENISPILELYNLIIDKMRRLRRDFLDWIFKIEAGNQPALRNCVYSETGLVFPLPRLEKTGKLSVCAPVLFLFLTVLPTPPHPNFPAGHWMAPPQKSQTGLWETKIRLDPSANMEWSAKIMSILIVLTLWAGKQNRILSYCVVLILDNASQFICLRHC